MSNPRKRAAEDTYEAQDGGNAGHRVRSDSSDGSDGSYVSDDQRKTGGPQVVRDEDADLGADAAPGSVTNSDAQLGKCIHPLGADGWTDMVRVGLMNRATGRRARREGGYRYEEYPPRRREQGDPDAWSGEGLQGTRRRGGLAWQGRFGEQQSEDGDYLNALRPRDSE